MGIRTKGEAKQVANPTFLHRGEGRKKSNSSSDCNVEFITEYDTCSSLLFFISRYTCGHRGSLSRVLTLQYFELNIGRKLWKMCTSKYKPNISREIFNLKFFEILKFRNIYNNISKPKHSCLLYISPTSTVIATPIHSLWRTMTCQFFSFSLPPGDCKYRKVDCTVVGH